MDSMEEPNILIPKFKPSFFFLIIYFCFIYDSLALLLVEEHVLNDQPSGLEQVPV